MKAIVRILLLLTAIFKGSQSCLFAQNLIPNPGFEESKRTILKYWKQPDGSYNHYTPKSDFGAINGLCFHYGETTEYLLIKLLKPLEAGHKYCISCKAMRNYYQPYVEIFLSPVEFNVSELTSINENATLKLPFHSANNEFETLSGSFTATRQALYLVVGRFKEDYEKFDPEIYQNQLSKVEEEIAAWQAVKKEEAEKAFKASGRDPSDKLAKNIFENNFYRTRYPLIDERFMHKRDSLNMQFGKIQASTGTIYFDDFCLSEIVDDSCTCPHTYVPIISTPVKNTSQPYRLEGVRFATDSATLKPESFSSLDSLADFLRSNNEIKIHITGHTDSSGNEAHNIDLSIRRAFAVKSYLITKGISENRLSSEGLGSSQPSAPNTTPEGRKWNRRVEFVIEE